MFSTGFAAMGIVALLSHLMIVESRHLSPSSFNSSKIHITSQVVITIDLYYASADDLVTTVCQRLTN